MNGNVCWTIFSLSAHAIRQERVSSPLDHCWLLSRSMGAPGAHALPFSVTVNHMQGGLVVLLLKHFEAQHACQQCSAGWASQLLVVHQK